MPVQSTERMGTVTNTAGFAMSWLVFMSTAGLYWKESQLIICTIAPILLNAKGDFPLVHCSGRPMLWLKGD